VWVGGARTLLRQAGAETASAHGQSLSQSVSHYSSGSHSTAGQARPGRNGDVNFTAAAALYCPATATDTTPDSSVLSANRNTANLKIRQI